MGEAVFWLGAIGFVAQALYAIGLLMLSRPLSSREASHVRLARVTVLLALVFNTNLVVLLSGLAAERTCPLLDGCSDDWVFVGAFYAELVLLVLCPIYLGRARTVLGRSGHEMSSQRRTSPSR